MKNSLGMRNGFSWGTLLAVFALLSASAVAPEAVQTQENRDKKRVVFDEDDLKVEKVRGKGMVSVLPDIRQADDYSVPVIVTYVNTFFGRDKYAGRLKVLEAKIENRGNKPTQAIQLRWTIVSRENHETVLLEGAVSFLEAKIEPQSTLLTDIPPIYFNIIAKPLLKGGVLDDNVHLMVGVQEVRFADGSTWQQPRQTAFLKVGYGGPAVAQSAAAQDPEREMPFSEKDLKEKKVDGEYKFSAIPELKQVHDPGALVIINRVNASAGRGKYAGLLKIASVGVENRNHRAVKSLRLKWRMVSAENPQQALLEGGTPLFAVTISPQSSKVIEVPHVFFNRIVKPLLKNNELHGNYHLVISVSDALFEDGTGWQWVLPITFVRTSYAGGLRNRENTR